MNQVMLQGFHWYSEGNGVLYNELKEKASYLNELGISSLWLPPAYKASGGGYSVGYDPYDLYDLGEFDQKGTIPTKYGTKQELISACKELQESGISIIADIVINHKAGGDEKEQFHVVRVNPENRQENLSEPFEIESYTKFTFPGRKQKYSCFEWDFTCFSGVDYAEGQEAGIFQIINEFGEGWEEVIGDEKGNYDYLMYNDIEHRNPFVREELGNWGKWYHDQIFFDGLRLDAVKHQSPNFYKEWLNNLRSNTGKNLFAVGEYWAPGQLPLLLEYIEATEECMSLFDPSLQHQFHLASKQGEEFDLTQIFEGTLTKERPDLSVTVVANHDTQPLQQLEAPVEPWFKPLAYALILLREDGYPCLFYPDLFGASYKDQGEDGKEYEIFLPKVEGLELLLKARKKHAFGLQRDFFSEPTCIGWTREGDSEHEGIAVVLSNAGENRVSMEVGTRYAGTHFSDLLGHIEQVVEINESGWGEFPCPAGSLAVFSKKEN
ncbi:alpha-amylase [Chryseobacterium sp. A301]